MRPVEHYDAGMDYLVRARRATQLGDAASYAHLAIAHALLGLLIHSELPDDDPEGFADWREVSRKNA